jgi:hypothetical protein
MVTKDLKSKNIDTLIEWCVKYKALLDNMKSNLHFEALKLNVSHILYIHTMLVYFTIKNEVV